MQQLWKSFAIVPSYKVQPTPQETCAGQLQGPQIKVCELQIQPQQTAEPLIRSVFKDARERLG